MSVDLIKIIHNASGNTGLMKDGIARLFERAMSPTPNGDAPAIPADVCITYDNVVQEACRKNRVVTQALIDAGLTRSFDATCTPFFATRNISVAARANVQMNCATDPGFNPAPNVAARMIALPYIASEWQIDSREACQWGRAGANLDTIHPTEAGRAVAETIEDLVLNGNSKLNIAGINSFGMHNGIEIGLGANWMDEGTYGCDILTSLINLVSQLINKKCGMGPYHVIMPCGLRTLFANPYSAECCQTTLMQFVETSLATLGVTRILWSECQPNDKITVYEANSRTVRLLNGLAPTIIPMVDPYHCLQKFKLLAIQVPEVSPISIKKGGDSDGECTMIACGVFDSDPKQEKKAPARTRTEAAAKASTSKPKAA